MAHTMAQTDKISFVTWMASLPIRYMTKRRGVLVGSDKYGNQYYQEKEARPGMKQRRWVIYRGEPDASLVPPEWHGWLHYNQKEPLPEGSPFHKPWQKEHVPNLTGTLGAYRPPGHAYEGGRRARATGDYEAWTPD